MKCGTIYVKRHSGYSSYESDPEVIINWHIYDEIPNLCYRDKEVSYH